MDRIRQAEVGLVICGVYRAVETRAHAPAITGAEPTATEAIAHGFEWLTVALIEGLGRCIAVLCALHVGTGGQMPSLRDYALESHVSSVSALSRLGRSSHACSNA